MDVSIITGHWPGRLSIIAKSYRQTRIGVVCVNNNVNGTNRRREILAQGRRRLQKWRAALGKRGEDHIADIIQASGWQVIGRNWRAGRYAEIDIIARDESGVLVFLEVKTRWRTQATSGFQSEGFDAIHWKKQRKMITAATLFLTREKIEHHPYRLDVAVVTYEVAKWLPLSQRTEVFGIQPTVTHVRGAFEPPA